MPAKAKELAERLAPLLTKANQAKLSRDEVRTLLASLAEKDRTIQRPIGTRPNNFTWRRPP